MYSARAVSLKSLRRKRKNNERVPAKTKVSYNKDLEPYEELPPLKHPEFGRVEHSDDEGDLGVPRQASNVIPLAPLPARAKLPNYRIR